jgi:hypothetical protein
MKKRGAGSTWNEKQKVFTAAEAGKFLRALKILAELGDESENEVEEGIEQLNAAGILAFLGDAAAASGHLGIISGNILRDMAWRKKSQKKMDAGTTVEWPNGEPLGGTSSLDDHPDLIE